MKLDNPYENATPEEGATVVPHPYLLGCSALSYTGIEGGLANVAMIRRLRLDGRIQLKPNISELTRRGNTSSTLIGVLKCISRGLSTSFPTLSLTRPLRRCGTVDLSARETG
jgi:hypothetical protein